MKTVNHQIRPLFNRTHWKIGMKPKMRSMRLIHNQRYSPDVGNPCNFPYIGNDPVKCREVTRTA